MQFSSFYRTWISDGLLANSSCKAFLGICEAKEIRKERRMRKDSFQLEGCASNRVTEKQTEKKKKKKERERERERKREKRE